jgi:hypothetical protein
MNLQVGLGWGAAIVMVGALTSLAFLRMRRDPRESERRRREQVRLNGRVIEGYVSECENGIVRYSYHWRGVRYEASQEIFDIPGAWNRFEEYSGPITVKFLGSQPSNSIVASERWGDALRVPIQHAIVAEPTSGVSKPALSKDSYAPPDRG